MILQRNWWSVVLPYDAYSAYLPPPMLGKWTYIIMYGPCDTAQLSSYWYFCNRCRAGMVEMSRKLSSIDKESAALNPYAASA